MFNPKIGSLSGTVHWLSKCGVSWNQSVVEKKNYIQYVFFLILYCTVDYLWIVYQTGEREREKKVDSSTIM